MNLEKIEINKLFIELSRVATVSTEKELSIALALKNIMVCCQQGMQDAAGFSEAWEQATAILESFHSNIDDEKSPQEIFSILDFETGDKNKSALGDSGSKVYSSGSNLVFDMKAGEDQRVLSVSSSITPRSIGRGELLSVNSRKIGIWKDGKLSEVYERSVNCDGGVKLPESVEQAELMQKIGYEYLKQNAPERLQPDSQALSNDEVEFWVIGDGFSYKTAKSFSDETIKNARMFNFEIYPVYRHPDKNTRITASDVGSLLKEFEGYFFENSEHFSSIVLAWDTWVSMGGLLEIEKLNDSKYGSRIVAYPSGKGRLITPNPDRHGVVIVLDESGEYKRVAKVAIDEGA